MTDLAKLDKTDKKILYHLDQDSRMSSTKLAKVLRKSREVTDYRIKNLIGRGVIQRFYAHINPRKLGFAAYKIYFKIKGLNSEQEKELKQYLHKHGNVYRVLVCNGVYDLIIAIWAQDVFKLHEVLLELYHKYDAYFISKDITITNNIYLCRKVYLQGLDKDTSESLFSGGQKGSIRLDPKDTELLKVLANNARMPVTHIAKKLNVTSGTIIYRIKELQKNGILKAFRCAIDLDRLGYVTCKAFLSLNFIDSRILKELKQFCAQHPHISLYLECIGSWDYEIEFEVPSIADFHKLLKEIKTRFSKIIKKCESVVISQEYKYDHFPGAYSSDIEE